MNDFSPEFDVDTVGYIDSDAIVRSICKNEATANDIQKLGELVSKVLREKFQGDAEVITEGFQEALYDLAKNRDIVMNADRPGIYFIVMARHATARLLPRIKKIRLAERDYAVPADAMDPAEELITPLIRQENHQKYLRFLEEKEADNLPHHATIMRLRLEQGIRHYGIAEAVALEEHVVRGTFTRCAQQLLELLELI